MFECTYTVYIHICMKNIVKSFDDIYIGATGIFNAVYAALPSDGDCKVLVNA